MMTCTAAAQYAEARDDFFAFSQQYNVKRTMVLDALDAGTLSLAEAEVMVDALDGQYNEALAARNAKYRAALGM